MNIIKKNKNLISLLVKLITSIIAIIMDCSLYNKFYSAIGSISDSGDIVAAVIMKLFLIFMLLYIGSVISKYISNF